MKLLLINIIVFVILIILLFETHIEPNNILETGIGFYSMELGYLIAKPRNNNKKKKDNKKGDK